MSIQYMTRVLTRLAAWPQFMNFASIRMRLCPNPIPVLEFEPGNSTALEFLPLILERLRLDAELPSESSSDR